MKHLLPIFTLALLGAAATASAENFYYDYYKDPGDSGVSNDYWVVDDWNKYETETDTFSYKNFKVSRNSDWAWVGKADSEVTGKAEIDNSNFYRIQVIGNDVDLFLTDFVDNVGSPTNANALYNRISEYGYRQLSLVDGKYVPTGDLKKYSITVPEDGGSPVITEVNGSNSTTAQKIDTLTFTREESTEDGSGKVTVSYDVDRYKYHLGTFSDGAIIELYMNDGTGEAYSYSGINVLDPAQNNAPIAPEGAFGDGGYRVNLETDEMLNGYYFQDEELAEHDLKGFNGDNDARALASSKAMPLSALDPTAGNRVYFGIIASTGGNSGNNGNGNGNGAFGQPLPGGLQIALIAGLFGLGFWYVRRRKSTVA